MSTDIPTLENFLFAEDKEEFLKKLVHGTNPFYFYTLTNALNQKGSDLSPQEIQYLEAYKNQDSQEAHSIFIRHVLLKLKEADNEADRNKIMKQISEFLNICTTHTQTNQATAQRFMEQDQLTYGTSDTLNEEDLSIWKYLKTSSLLSFNIDSLEEEYLSQVDLTFVAELEQYQIDSFLSRIKNSIAVMKGIPQFLSNQYRKNYVLNQAVLPYLTVDQLTELTNLQPNILQEVDILMLFLCKKFELDAKLSQGILALRSSARVEKQKALLKGMLEWTRNLPLKRQSLEDFIIKHLLILGQQTNEFDFDLFVLFLKNPSVDHSQYNVQQRKCWNDRHAKFGASQDNFSKDEILIFLGIPKQNITDQVLIDKYAHQYISTYEKYDILVAYFQEKHLQKILLKIQLQKGKSVPEITKFLQQQEIQTLNEKKFIKIAAFNKDFFEGNDQVKIEVAIKNIPQMTVKLFEVNTENYYKKNMAAISQNIELDGLIASEETSFEFKQPPIQKFTQTFLFESIQKKSQGVFIIDFLGNGVSSRAIIQKGCLVLKEKKTLAGHAFQILDQNLDICKGPKTGIFFQKKFYPLNSDNEVLIPYSNSVVQEKAIIIHGDFSQLTDIKINAETVSFKCAYIYTTQSMLMSSKAKVLLQPRLYLNNEPVPLTILKDTKVVVTSLSQMGISSSNTYDNIEFNHKSETEIEFPVAAKLQSITISVETKAKLMTKDEPQALTSSHTISFNQHLSERGFCSQNLRLTKSGYEIHLLGQNGEPKEGVTIELSFNVRGFTQPIKATLKTNSQGFISLKELKNVEKLTSDVTPQGGIEALSRTWTINNESQVLYPEEVTVTTEEPITFSFLKNELDQNVSLFKTLKIGSSEESIIVSNESSKLSVSNQTLSINPLPEGTYKLWLRDLGVSIIINVLKGQYWQKTENIKTASGLVQQQKQPTVLMIEKVQVETPKESETGNTLKIKVRSDGKDLVRVHVIALHYLQEDVNNVSSQLDDLLVSSSQEGLINLIKALNSNIYQSNKILPDEIRYALDRKRHQRHIGNTLEKPHLLLKNTFIRDTTFDTEQLGAGGDYASSSNQQEKLLSQVDQLFGASKPFGKKSKQMKGGYDQRSFGYGYSAPNQGGENQQVDCYNNYLLHPALVASNLRPDKEGNITLPNLPLSKYSTLQIIATDLFNNVTHIEPLEKNTVEKRNLCQRVNPQKEKFFTISRTNEQVPAGGLFKSSDFTSTELQLVDSLGKVFAAQKELRKISGTDTEQSNGYDFWDILVKWPGYTLDEKNKKYDKFACHELNLYIYCKDPPFFKDFVLPFIQNKIEKTFIDRFLLSDDQYLIKASSANALSNLNALEKVLLILYLKQNGKIEEAKGIYSYLESANKILKYDTQHFKKLFDTVLNAKTQGESEGQNLIGLTTFAPSIAMQQGFNLNTNMMVQQNINCLANFSNIAPQQMCQQMYQPPMQYQQQQQQYYQQSYAPNPYSQMECDIFNNCDYNACDDVYSAPAQRYEQKRSGFVQQYRNTETTKEYVERHYYSQTQLTNQADLIPVNSFWLDLAKHILTHGMDSPFLSANFIYCAANHTQMIAALSFLALPFEAKSHNYEPYEGKGIKITLATNAIIFAKQIKEGQAALREDILISQKFFDPDDRYVFSDENPDDKYEKVITEYVIDKRYGCQVIVTNCSAARHELQVLVEIPSGSIPVTTNDYTKTHNIILEPFSTKPIEYYFYFPSPGKQEIYPANVAKSGQIVAVAKVLEFEVNAKRTVSNLETMNEILQKGSKEDILNFVATKNILNTNIFQFSEIYYLLRDKNFFTKFISILKSRKIYDETTWGYSAYHSDYNSFIELLNSQGIQNQLLNYISFFESEEFTISKHRFFEYAPLSNPRVHMLHQDKSNILNREFKQKYLELLQYLAVKKTWSVTDRLGLVYYFLLQDRIEEAIQQFNSIAPSEVAKSTAGQLQYDYFSSYLDLFVGFPNFRKARELCEKYLDYPIVSWRNLFYEVANKLAEYDGEEEEEDSSANTTGDAEDETKKNKKQQQKKKEELSEELRVELTNDAQIEITSQNISQLTVNYFLIDLEILFSRNPFLSKDKSDFGFVQPNLSQTIQIDVSKGLLKQSIPIPEKFKNSNVSVEVTSQNTQKTVTYFSTSLQTIAVQELGQIKVLDKTEKPLSKVYVKCFAQRKDGTVAFHKDGYTDLVGRFDYTSLSASDITNVSKFSIFVCSDELGALIKEVSPPSQVGQIVEEVKLRGAQWNRRADDRNNLQHISYANKQEIQKKCKNAFY